MVGAIFLAMFRGRSPATGLMAKAFQSGFRHTVEHEMKVRAPRLDQHRQVPGLGTGVTKVASLLRSHHILMTAVAVEGVGQRVKQDDPDKSQDYLAGSISHDGGRNTIVRTRFLLPLRSF